MKNFNAISLIFAANTVSGISQGVSMLAIPWYFIDVLDAPALFAQIYFTVTLVSLVWGIYAGALVDRYDRKHLMLAEGVFGATLFLLAGVAGWHYGGLSTWVVGGLFATTIFTYNLHYPTLYAFAQELVGAKDYNKITSYIEIQGQTSTVIAGGLAALLLSGVDWQVPQAMQFFGFEQVYIKPWELYEIFLLDGCTYVLSFLIVLFIRYESTVRRVVEEESLLTRLKVGVRFLLNKPMVLLFGSVAPIIFASVLVTNFMLAPNYIHNVLHEEAAVFASSELFFAFGSVMAGVFIRKIFANTNAVMACFYLSITAGVIYFIFASFEILALYFFAVLILGLTNAGSRIMRMTYVLQRVPNQVIGRVGSVFMVVNVLIRLVFSGLFALSFFVENVQMAFYLFMFACFGAAAILFFNYRAILAVPEIEQT